jgi:hypothetical protein
VVVIDKMNCRVQLFMKRESCKAKSGLTKHSKKRIQVFYGARRVGKLTTKRRRARFDYDAGDLLYLVVGRLGHLGGKIAF